MRDQFHRHRTVKWKERGNIHVKTSWLIALLKNEKLTVVGNNECGRVFYSFVVRAKNETERCTKPSYRNFIRMTICLCVKREKALQGKELLKQGSKNKNQNNIG